MEDNMKTQTEADAAQFERVRHWKTFRAEARNLFPTDDALRWFMRQHEAALVTAGALLKLPRGNFIDPGPFKAMALNLMRSALAGAAGQCTSFAEVERQKASRRPDGGDEG